MDKTKLTAKETKELRLVILENSLLVEAQITDFLAIALNLDKKKSLILGDTSSALSLKTKINLLIDLGMLDTQQKKKLVLYLEIRNKFLHNWQCRSFLDCFKSLEGPGKFLKKLYQPQDHLNEESEFAFCYNQLSKDIIYITMETLTKVSQHKANYEVSMRMSELYPDLRTRTLAYLCQLQQHPVFEKYNVSDEDRQIFRDDFQKEFSHFKKEL